MKNKTLLLTMAMAFALAIPLIADHDVDLPINGEFYGEPIGYSPATGWTLTSGGGQARVLPRHGDDDFMLELQANPHHSQSVLSDMHRLPGNLLKLELNISGTGTASAGYEAYDMSGKVLVAADSQPVTLTRHEQKVKRHFPLPPQAKNIKIRLTAEAGATALFRDVEAEVSYAEIPSYQLPPPPSSTIQAPPPSPGTIPAPPPPGTMQAPGSEHGHRQPPHPHRPHHHGKPLQNDSFIEYKSLGEEEVYEVSLRSGKEIEFNLEEKRKKGISWQIVSYDPNICRVKLDHDHVRMLFERHDAAEIEIKALRPGSTRVIFNCDDKTFIVNFTSY